MSKIIISLIFVVIVSILVSVRAKDDDKTVSLMTVQTDGQYVKYGNTTDCDNTALTINTTSGALKINGTINGKSGKTCEWIIDGTASKGPHIYLAFDENLILSNNDSLKIMAQDAKNTTLYESKGFQWPGVILLDGKQKILIQLILADESAANFSRNWDVLFGTNTTSISIQNIESTGKFVFPYNSEAELKTDFKITLRSKSSDKNLLLNLETLDLNGGTVAFDKVQKYANQSLSSSTAADFLLSKDNQISITISKFPKLKKESKGFEFHYDLVDSVCSQYKTWNDIDVNEDTIGLKFPDNNSLLTMSSFRCLNIFEHNITSAKLLLNLRDFEFKNSGDLMTVLDGNRRDSKTIAVIESQFLDSYWKQLYLYSTANKMWVMFESPQVINRDADTSGVGVEAYSQGGSLALNVSAPNSTSLELKKGQSSQPITFIYSADSSKQVIIDMDEKNKLPGTPGQKLIDIYDSDSRDGQPFVSLSSGEYPPDIIASNNNQMKVVFNQTIDLSAKMTTYPKGFHSTYLGLSGSSFNPNGQCSGLCSWLIPKKDNSSGTFVLQFSHLSLPKETDELIITTLGTTTSTVLSLKGPLSTTFPDLILRAKETYVLYLRRQCDKTSEDSSQLIGVSLIYVNEDLTTHNETIERDKSEELKTNNYPNYYSVGSDHRWRVDPPTNQTVDALLSFIDIDLSPGHQLLVQNQNLSLTLSSTVGQSDVLVTLPLYMNLSSNSLDMKKQPFSGRGFTANLTTVNCGGVLKVDPGKEVSLLTPTLTGISKCIWTVTTTNPNATAIGLLEFTINDKDLEKDIRISDSNSIRDNKWLNFTYFNTTRMSSSTNSLIIEYTIADTKNPKPLNLTFKQTVCQQKCVNGKRCIIPEFFCNGIDDCGDFSDERCNGSKPIPPEPRPAPIVYHSGVNGWVVFLVICPLSIGLGVLGTLYGPRLMSRVGRGRYREFQDFSEVS